MMESKFLRVLGSLFLATLIYIALVNDLIWKIETVYILSEEPKLNKPLVKEYQLQARLAFIFLICVLYLFLCTFFRDFLLIKQKEDTNTPCRNFIFLLAIPTLCFIYTIFYSVFMIYKFEYLAPPLKLYHDLPVGYQQQQARKKDSTKSKLVYSFNSFKNEIFKVEKSIWSDLNRKPEKGQNPLNQLPWYMLQLNQLQYNYFKYKYIKYFICIIFTCIIYVGLFIKTNFFLK
jgi:hypothetical protein